MHKLFNGMNWKYTTSVH